MSPEELEGEIQVGRIQRTDTGYEVTVANRAELFRKGRLIAVVTVDGEPIEWNPALHSDPRIKANENRGEGAGFLFSPYFHKKGLFLQNVIKRGIISTINLTYKQILRFYDKDAFVFEDPRLNKLRLFCKTYVAFYYGEEARGGTGIIKLTFMYQFFDIMLFLMKEDIFYRTRFFEFLNNVPKGWELTEAEIKNLEEFN
jgi:hypothetical protein